MKGVVTHRKGISSPRLRSAGRVEAWKENAHVVETLNEGEDEAKGINVGNWKSWNWRKGRVTGGDDRKSE
ncbi:hypothetical protein L596_011031 [Steinernema carpocapsae]|uniref:Uncharacterized protein n=1 Tax=Steinernema carpocapsae TaxID=34508 RepID=A0A4U5NS51_STECR|nr:hypothetical protein L596_011031 [Steinernema carpocapsae]